MMRCFSMGNWGTKRRSEPRRTGVALCRLGR
jgi:hypothetical protein